VRGNNEGQYRRRNVPSFRIRNTTSFPESDVRRSGRFRYVNDALFYISSDRTGLNVLAVPEFENVRFRRFISVCVEAKERPAGFIKPSVEFQNGSVARSSFSILSVRRCKIHKILNTRWKQIDGTDTPDKRQTTDVFRL